MWWNFVAQMGDTVAFRHLSPQLAHFAHQGIDLLLLPKDGLVELFQPVLAEAGLDFQIGQALIHLCMVLGVVVVVHGLPYSKKGGGPAS